MPVILEGSGESISLDVRRPKAHPSLCMIFYMTLAIC